MSSTRIRQPDAINTRIMTGMEREGYKGWDEDGGGMGETGTGDGKEVGPYGRRERDRSSYRPRTVRCDRKGRYVW